MFCLIILNKKTLKINQKHLKFLCTQFALEAVTVEPLYSGHPLYRNLVIADRFYRIRPDPGQTPIANPLYGGQFYGRPSL